MNSAHRPPPLGDCRAPSKSLGSGTGVVSWSGASMRAWCCGCLACCNSGGSIWNRKEAQGAMPASAELGMHARVRVALPTIAGYVPELPPQKHPGSIRAHPGIKACP